VVVAEEEEDALQEELHIELLDQVVEEVLM
jgi:hypothetical protein